MPKYLIHRPLPGAGQLSPDELQGISATSAGVLAEMAPAVQWLHSYVTDDAINCVYVATDEDAVREHARRGGFPCERITTVSAVLDPSWADS